MTRALLLASSTILIPSVGRSFSSCLQDIVLSSSAPRQQCLLIRGAVYHHSTPAAYFQLSTSHERTAKEHPLLPTMAPPATAFAAGSTEPTRAPGQLRIYSMRFCPFAARTLLVLSAKEIPHEIVNINLVSKPEWYLKKFASGKVPLLENDGILLPESLVTSEYLDEAFDGRKLLPQDPYQKALDKVFLESFSFSPLFKVYHNKDQYSESFDGFWTNAATVEAELKKRGTKFIGGKDAPGFVDLMIWPFFQLAIGMTTLYPDLKIPREKYALISSWLDSMLATREVKNLVNQDHLAEYMRLKINGKNEYDIGL